MIQVACQICGSRYRAPNYWVVERICAACLRWVKWYESNWVKWYNKSNATEFFWCDLGMESHYGVYRQDLTEGETRETMLAYDGDLSKHWER